MISLTVTYDIVNTVGLEGLTVYEGFGDDLPLRKEHLDVLIHNFPLLVGRISLDCGLLDYVASKGGITWQQRHDILRSSECEPNVKFLYILMKRSVADLKTCFSCLRQNGQSHVNKELKNNIGEGQHLLNSHFYGKWSKVHN